MAIIRDSEEYMRPLGFYPSVAKQVGVDSAILFQIIIQRVDGAMLFLRDKTQSADFYKVQDGRVWVQFPYSEFEKMMPWVSASTIKRVIRNLKQKGMLLFERQMDSVRGNQANWYSVNPIDPLP